jgi:hypothetical protein
MKAIEANCSVGNKKIAVNMISPEGRIEIQFTSPQVIHEGEVLAIEINGVRPMKQKS